MIFGKQVTSPAVVACLVTLGVLWYIAKVAFNNDLRKIPGPFLSRFTDLPLKVAVLAGKRSIYIHSLHEKYGPFVRIAPTEVAIADIEAWRKIHRIGSDFPKGPWYQGQSPYQYSDETCGVFCILDPKTASKRRRLFQAAGTRKSVAEWEPQVIETVDLAIIGIRRELKTEGSSDVMKWWLFMASDVVGYLAFGESFNNVRRGQKDQFIRDLEEIMPYIGLRVTLPWLGKLVDIIPPSLLGRYAPPWDRYNAAGRKAVENTRLAGKSGNHTLFTQMAGENEALATIPDSLIEQEAANIIVAGTDTTAMSLTYLVFAVLKHPEVKARLVQEIHQSSEHPMWSELEAMPYLNNVIMESMRLYPALPGSLTRQVPKGGEDLGKRVLPTGTLVSTQAWTFQRDPTVFADPLRFNPDRWNNPTPAMKEYFMAFGCPSRFCLGQNIARLEMLHAVFRFFRACPDAKLAPCTTEESMQMVDFFAIKPMAQECRIVAG